MVAADSALDPEALAYARGLLKPPIVSENLWGVLAAAAFAAISAMAFATAMIMAPPATTSGLVMEEPTEVAPAGSEPN